MKKYQYWAQTPLRWHYFTAYFQLPLGIVITVLRLPQAADTYSLLSGTEFEWLGALACSVYVANIITSVISIFGSYHKQWYGPRCLLLVYCENMILPATDIYFGYVSTGIASIASIFIMAVLTWIYYQKRRALFSPAKSEPAKPIETDSSTIPVPEHKEENQESPNSRKSFYLPETISEEEEENESENTEQKEKNENKLVSPPSKAAHGGKNIVGKPIVILVSALFLLVSTLCFYLAYDNYSLRSQVEEKEKELLQKEEYNETLQQQKENWKDRYYSQVDESEKERTELYLELSFWRDYAVIIVDGEYHTYGCDHLNGSRFFILNLNMAKDLGYEPCPDCNPPTGDPTRFIVTPKDE